MRFVKIVMVSVVALVIVNACADDAARNIGKMMVDAGAALGGRPAREAGSGGSNGGRGGKGGHGGEQSYGRDGGMLADAGQALIDGGRALLDAADQQVPDAAAETPLTATNGSRIKLRRNTSVGGDGTRYEEPWLTYFDTTFGTPCILMVIADGKQRCVPQPGLSASPVVERFSDAACTSRLVLVSGSCEAAAYAYDTSSVMTQCEGSGTQLSRAFYRFYRRGARHTGQEYAKDYQNACMPVAAAAGYQSYLVGAELQPSEFVEFTSTATDVP